jgi:hypothetical protein
MSIELRVVNYTSTDEDGEKIYTRHAMQTRRKDGPWIDVPVIEIYKEFEFEADVPDNKPDKAITKLKTAVVRARELDDIAAKIFDEAGIERSVASSAYNKASRDYYGTTKARTAAINDYDAAVEAHVREDK